MKRNQLALIHIAKQALGMDENTYRAMLERVAGVRSAKSLDQAGFDAVMTHFARCGWQPTPSKKHGKPPRILSPTSKKISAILADSGRPWRYADAMAKHMFGVERLDWLSQEQQHKILVALIVDAKRRESANAER